MGDGLFLRLYRDLNMPAIASLEDLKAVQKDLVETKDLSKFNAQ
jgi:hypothetical protein